MGAASDSSDVQRPRSNQQESRDPAPAPHRWERSLIIFNGLLVIVGILQVWTYMASERAFVAVEVPVVRFTIGESLVVRFRVKNSGRTTAFITKALVNLRFTANLEKVPQYKPGVRTSIKGPLVAGGTLPTALRAEIEDGKTFIWDEKIASTVNAGTLNFYAYGFINYQTQFRLFRTFLPEVFSHSTGFCYVYRPTNKNWDFCEEDAYKYGD